MIAEFGVVRVRGLPVALGVVLAVFALGCSSPGPGGSVIGQAGAPSVAGGAGAISLDFGGASAGGASAGTSGTGGAPALGGQAGATASAADVFSPTLDKPGHDCRTDLETKDCVSVAGVVAGKGFNEYCADANSPVSLLLSPPRWPTACAAIQQNYQVDVPVQAAGSFHAKRSPTDSAGGINVRFVLNGAGGDSLESNFVAAEVAGNVTADPTTGDAIVVGTFHATWGMPDASCELENGKPCLAADLNGTFRSDNYLKP